LARLQKAQWLKLTHHLQESLSGQESFLEHSVEEQALVQKATFAAKGKGKRNAGKDIHIDLEEASQARKSCLWDQEKFGSRNSEGGKSVAGARNLGWSEVPGNGFRRKNTLFTCYKQILWFIRVSHKTCLLTQVMTLNRLIEPSSELAMSDWVARSALSDILKEDFRRLSPIMRWTQNSHWTRPPTRMKSRSILKNAEVGLVKGFGIWFYRYDSIAQNALLSAYVILPQVAHTDAD
jgi:hypothetical protein